jgi:ubiquitin-protein ligase
MFAKRLAVEVKKARTESTPLFYLFPEGESLMNWKAFLIGPQDSPYEDGVFQINMQATQVPSSN